MDDLITTFFQATEGSISPPIFRRWSGIAMAAMALERRVWIKTYGLRTFPNLYVLLVGGPGAGKSIIAEVKKLIVATKEPQATTPAFHVGSHSLTDATLFDEIDSAKKARVNGSGMFIYHSLAIIAEEMQHFLPAFNPLFIARLNEIYNNDDSLSENRRHGKKKGEKVEIVYPQLNILGGAQPTYIASTFPEEAWSTGLARRLIMVYSAGLLKYKLSDVNSISSDARRDLVAKLSKLAACYGEIKYTDEALGVLNEWHDNDRPPKPKHSKLQHYETNRTQNVIKLAGISAMSRAPDLMTIELIDIQRAMNWLLEAERLMPDVFREMVGRSDAQIIEELHAFMIAEWRRNGQKPLDGELIYAFVHQRTSADKVNVIIDVAEKSGVIARMASTMSFVPRPKYLHGGE